MGGDIVDRGDDAEKIFRLFFRLREQAMTVGGAVLNLIGNHELMNIQNDLRYVTKKDIKQFGGRKQRAKAWAPDGWLGHEVRHFPVAAKLGDVLFVHAGLTLDLLDGLSLLEFNSRFDKAIET